MGPNTGITILDWAFNQGFGILVAVYLLVRMEAKIDTLTEAINRLG